MQGIVGRVLKFAGYIHPNIAWEYYWPHFEKQDGHHVHFSTIIKEFCWLSRAKGTIDRDLKFPGYVHHNKILTGKFWPHFEKQDGHHPLKSTLGNRAEAVHHFNLSIDCVSTVSCTDVILY